MGELDNEGVSTETGGEVSQTTTSGQEQVTSQVSEEREHIDRMTNELTKSLFGDELETPEGKQEQEKKAPAKDDKGRLRGADGKFTTDPNKQVAPVTDSKVTETVPGQQPNAIKAPGTWRKEALSEWDKIPPIAQAEILRREQNFFDGIKAYKQSADIGKQFDDVFRPFIPAMSKYGMHPIETVRQLLTAHFNLTFSDRATKVGLIRGLLKDYGIDPNDIFDQSLQGPSEAEMKLLRQVQETQAFARKVQAQYNEGVRAQIGSQVEAFAADPAHPYFNEVANKMTELIQSGMCRDLQTAYDQACLLTDDVRAKMSTSSTPQPAQKQDMHSVQAAAAASANLSSQGQSGKPEQAKDQSLDELLASTLRDIRHRG